jgi:hypothetical protein
VGDGVSLSRDDQIIAAADDPPIGGCDAALAAARQTVFVRGGMRKRALRRFSPGEDVLTFFSLIHEDGRHGHLQGTVQ